MNYRPFGRLGWEVSEIGYGMWGLAGWSGTDQETMQEALQLSVDLGCNFFDTALAYGDGKSEQILGQLIRANVGKKLYVATKIPPMNRKWPSQRHFPLSEVFPSDYLETTLETCLKNLNISSIDLLQFHVWEDNWTGEPSWQRTVASWKQQGLIRAIGISINRWEPWNAIRAIRTGLIDSVQVIYNIFDQNPEDELFPICEEFQVAVIARVPFDEGTLTGTLTKDSTWPEGDWRNTYFVPENLIPSIERAEALRPLIPPGATMAEMALRFILSNPQVKTIIPGMRSPKNVRMNLGTSEQGKLPKELLAQLKTHRWDRRPTEWSQ